MRKLFAMTLFVCGLAGVAAADETITLNHWTEVTVPEIDASSAVGALALASGVVLILRARKK
jgi:hypothetical protein